eukprot:snap_masked-scaffold_25-processed-gene-4.28-mRNA-1 protein AED:1.00 eAED:1.00 QI:0/0/0/0/1/1/2/0/542
METVGCYCINLIPSSREIMESALSYPLNYEILSLILENEEEFESKKIKNCFENVLGRVKNLQQYNKKETIFDSVVLGRIYPLCLLILGRLALLNGIKSMNNMEDAENILQQNIGGFKTDEHLNISNLLTLADVYVLNQKYESAAKTFEKLLNLPLKQIEENYAKYRLARTNVTLGKYSTALSWFSLISQGFNHPTVLNNKAHLIYSCIKSNQNLGNYPSAFRLGEKLKKQSEWRFSWLVDPLQIPGHEDGLEYELDHCSQNLISGEFNKGHENAMKSFSENKDNFYVSNYFSLFSILKKEEVDEGIQLSLLVYLNTLNQGKISSSIPYANLINLLYFLVHWKVSSRFREDVDYLCVELFEAAQSSPEKVPSHLWYFNAVLKTKQKDEESISTIFQSLILAIELLSFGIVSKNINLETKILSAFEYKICIHFLSSSLSQLETLESFSTEEFKLSLFRAMFKSCFILEKYHEFYNSTDHELLFDLSNAKLLVQKKLGINVKLISNRETEFIKQEPKLKENWRILYLKKYKLYPWLLESFPAPET